MAIELKKAQRKRAKLKLGIAGGSGSGKTLGALLVAYGLLKEKYPNFPDNEIWNKIAIVDTENGSGELYVGKEVGDLIIGEYNSITLEPPFEVDKFTDSIKLCYKSGMEVVILDSTSHAWQGEGGLLEQHGNISKRVGNSYAAWRDITPQHNKFVDTMLQTDIHLIATMRSKMDYTQEKDPNSGKTTVRKLGLEPIQRDGMSYEFTIFLEIDADHVAFGSKDRTGLVDQKYFTITPEVGKTIMRWLESGVDEKKEVISTSLTDSEQEKINSDKLKKAKSNVVEKCKYLGGSGNEELMKLLKEYEPSGNPNKIKDTDIIRNIDILEELLLKLNNVKPIEIEEGE